MDFVAHYRRAVELAEDADKNYADSVDPKYRADEREDCLRRAEVLAQMSQARGQLAWVAYMGVDALAAQQLAEDAQGAPDEQAMAAMVARLQDPARRDRGVSRIRPRGAS